MSNDPQRPPGAPGAVPPPYEEPTSPSGEAPYPKPDQTTPDTVTATGHPVAADPNARAQQGDRLTTAQGVPLRETDHSLKAGERGPALLQDHHLREKVMHFDHERIPERVVHARGAAAHGVFRSFGRASSFCCAQFLQPEQETPVFVRFSTVLGSRGSADTVRDTRGFAVKFYTEEGNFDLVGNNIPVFFIQDAIKFPDVIHAGKPHPDREIPQAQSAHDTFWDFVSLHTEAQHHTIWNMSDRGIPRSYRMMEGFGVHTFRLVAEDGSTTLAKFHWKPENGVHSLVWEEAQIAAGVDPDLHRRDLADAIEAGAYPRWTLGVQLFEDGGDQTFEGIDLLDPTKIVPEELAPVHPIGELILTRNPSNYFAETEQVAFHAGHFVRGIDATDDPLLQGRLFSYLDTQLTRLGGPNFAQIPINRPHAPVNDMLRDGFHQQAVHEGVAPYRPNSLDGGCPFLAGESGFIDTPMPLPQTTKTREAPASFDDHFSQPRLFWRSLSAIEQQHTIDAYAFELSKVYEPTIRERQLAQLARIDRRLCEEVAQRLGLPAPSADPGEDEGPVESSPALSQVGGTWPVTGRRVAVLVTEESTGAAAIVAGLEAQGIVAAVLSARAGEVACADGTVAAERPLTAARSIEFDAVMVGSGIERLDGPATSSAQVMIAEAHRHAKALAFWGEDGERVAEHCHVPVDEIGVIFGGTDRVVSSMVELLSGHRCWDRVLGI
ncbi:catalase HPII [Aeromicrobium sp. PE09-221]|uniref:catalase n=1 Tax=Aeromicrobium sp. PE09-221 TaxID=1898043 RepID=UPI000B3EB592|nr:catalase [Aeromicrobium sp. PE09-221]OUZ10997.1 catalase HPII [Aeromicrobium sp. PE09-221]